MIEINAEDEVAYKAHRERWWRANYPSERLFKVLNVNGLPYHGGSGRWPLPENGSAGEWLEVRGKLVDCENGLHLCRVRDLPLWFGPVIFAAELDGEWFDAGNKIIARKARLLRQLAWDDRIARHFACDCAERALKRERKAGRDSDKRSRETIRVARRFANGLASMDELAAAWDAAGNAEWRRLVRPWAAAWDAAGASAGWAARDAAEVAAWAAARDAAGATWGVATWGVTQAAAAAQAAERTWQTKRLLDYLDGKRTLPPI